MSRSHEEDDPISSLASIASNVVLAPGVRIGPFSVIGREGAEPVRIGKGTVVRSHVVIEPDCVVGSDCALEDHCRIGRGSVVADGSRIASGIPNSRSVDRRHGILAVPKGSERPGAISPQALVASNVLLGAESSIEAFAVVGWSSEAPVVIGARTCISPFALVEPGAVIGDDCFVDAYCRVATGATIGSRTQILYGAGVYESARVGEACIIGGNVADRTIIEDCVTHFGEIAHAYREPGDLKAWDTMVASSPTIRACSVIGQYAVIVGGVEIGRGSYVSAGEIVKVDVPAGQLFQNGICTDLRRLRGLVRARSDGPCA